MLIHIFGDDLPMPMEVIEETDEFLQRGNGLLQFLKDCTIFTKHGSTVKELMSALRGKFRSEEQLKRQLEEMNLYDANGRTRLRLIHPLFESGEPDRTKWLDLPEVVQEEFADLLKAISSLGEHPAKVIHEDQQKKSVLKKQYENNPDSESERKEEDKEMKYPVEESGDAKEDAPDFDFDAMYNVGGINVSDLLDDMNEMLDEMEPSSAQKFGEEVLRLHAQMRKAPKRKVRSDERPTSVYQKKMRKK